MGIYNTDGDLDLVEAATEVNAQTERTNRNAAEFTLARIETAALLDIAGSLRVLAHEASLKIGELDLFDETTLPDIRPEDAPAGSRVRIRNTDIEGTLNGSTGIDQGTGWVMVGWDDDHADSDAAKVWAEELEVVSLPGTADAPTLAEVRESETPLVGVATEAEAPALRTDEDEDGEEAVGGYELANTVADPDDLDDDFDGDEHPAAADALAALKAREKAAKAARARKGKK